VVYTEDGCTYSDDFELVVVAAPNVGVDTLDGTAFCAGDVGRFAPTGTLEPGATVSWIIPAGATVVDGDPMAFDTLTLQLGGAGPQMVSLAVNTPFCGTDTVGVDIAVTATPAPLQLDCANVSFDQVGFNWSHPTATGFTVTVLNQPAGASIVENAGSLLATGLAEGDSVTIPRDGHNRCALSGSGTNPHLHGGELPRHHLEPGCTRTLLCGRRRYPAA
jgi:hypothetical protein